MRATGRARNATVSRSLSRVNNRWENPTPTWETPTPQSQGRQQQDARQAHGAEHAAPAAASGAEARPARPLAAGDAARCGLPLGMHQLHGAARGELLVGDRIRVLLHHEPRLRRGALEGDAQLIGSPGVTASAGTVTSRSRRCPRSSPATRTPPRSRSPSSVRRCCPSRPGRRWPIPFTNSCPPAHLGGRHGERAIVGRRSGTGAVLHDHLRLRIVHVGPRRRAAAALVAVVGLVVRRGDHLGVALHQLRRVLRRADARGMARVGNAAWCAGRGCRGRWHRRPGRRSTTRRSARSS